MKGVAGFARPLALAGSLFASVAALASIGDRPPPEAYLDPIDRQIAATGKGLPGRPSPCAREEQHGSIRVIAGIPTEQCVRMEPPRTWRGLWRNEFEGSLFCPEPATTCEFKSGERIWLSERPNRRGDGKTYRVEFVGRKTLFKAAYGHMGVFDHEIVVDRMVAILPQP